MKQARKWLAALLAAVLILGALPMAALAEEDGTAAVRNLDEFKAALEDTTVRRIEITGDVVIPDGESLNAGEKEIHVSLTGNLLLNPGAVMTSDAPLEKFSFEEDDGVSQWDRIAYGMKAFLMDDSGHRLLLGSLPEDVGEAIDGKTLAVLGGDVTLESDADVQMLLVMDDGTLTISKGSKLTVTGLIHAKTVHDSGELWADESVDFDVEDYNCPRVVVCWEGDNYSSNFAMTPYDEYEIEKFALYDYRNGDWGYFDVNQAYLKFESPLSYGDIEGHERLVLTAKGAQWGTFYAVSCEGYVPLRVFIELPEIGCYSTPSASTSSVLTGSLKCSPVFSSEFYVCINPDAWFVREGYRVSELNIEAVRYDENGGHTLTNPPVKSQKTGNGVWKITAGDGGFNVEPWVTVTSPDGEDSFEIGTGIFLEPAQSLVYSGAPLTGERNDWGFPWKDDYRSTLRDTLSLKAGDSKDVYLYLLVYQGNAEGEKPAGWYCEDVNINQIRAEGVTVAQGKEDDDSVIRIIAGFAGAHKVIRTQEEQIGPDEWEMIPGSSRGEPLVVTVASSGSSGGSSGNGSGGGSGKSSSSKPAGNSTYDISAPNVVGGAVSVQPQNAKQGETVTVTVRPENGYALKTLSVTAGSGRKIETVEAGDGRYTFVMPGAKVMVRASFTKVQAEAPAGSFTDVAPSAYYRDAVQWAVENGITGGTGAGRFSPDAPCTRAQTVTFLWRAAGSPAPSGGENPLQDVPSGAYYHDAVLWAVEKGITGGVTADTFGPEAVVTRGQTAAFLHRAAGSPTAEGGSFADVPSGAYYAEAVQWAAEKGVTGGVGGGRFNPGASCTRAQIVTFLYRSREG